MAEDVEEIAAVARAAVEAGGAELRRRYRNDDADGDYGPHDVKAAADVAAEARMLPVVRRAFPTHAVFAEESGEFAGDDPYRWIIDPLDGTNNFVAGLPTFASSVAVLREGAPIVAAVHQPATDETYLARRDAGVFYDSDRVTAASDVSVDAATIVTISGRDVHRTPAHARQADAMRESLRDVVKRVLGSWAPTVHSGLFARGRFQGLVQFHPDEEEQAVTELLAAEADAVIRRDGPLFVAASDERTLETLWETVAEVR
jgi:myo-inositol-1(or 4)-monophosphatase